MVRKASSMLVSIRSVEVEIEDEKQGGKLMLTIGIVLLIIGAVAVVAGAVVPAPAPVSQLGWLSVVVGAILTVLALVLPALPT